jgi:hypothetical protein
VEVVAVHPEAVVSALDRACGRLEALGVPFALMGGMALATWKHARFTQDVDLLIASDVVDASRLIQSLVRAGFRLKRQPPIVTIDDSRFVQFLYEPPDVLMDIQVDLLFADTEFQKQSLARRNAAQLEGVDHAISVVACEDLVVYKLLASRMIDRADAAALLRLNRTTIDLEYLLKWVQNLELQSQFKQVWDEAFPGEQAPL